MRVFLDANILVSVLNKEYPVFTFSSRILSLADKNKFQLYTSPICLAIAFYFAEKKYKTASAKKRIKILCDHLNITPVHKSTVTQSLTNPAVNDFEDGIEYYSAVENKCNCIITEDVGDFYFSQIEVLSSECFFEKYLLNAPTKK